jgi:hypothetical protein
LRKITAKGEKSSLWRKQTEGEERMIDQEAWPEEKGGR